MRGVHALITLLLAACGRISFDPQPGGPSDALDSSSDARDAPMLQFVDDFERANSFSIGNAWVEKTPGTYGVNAGRLIRQAFANDYRDDIVVRPPNEDLPDVEVSIEFTVAHIPPGFPQVEARIQRSTFGVANTLEGYLFY